MDDAEVDLNISLDKLKQTSKGSLDSLNAIRKQNGKDPLPPTDRSQQGDELDLMYEELQATMNISQQMNQELIESQAYIDRLVQRARQGIATIQQSISSTTTQ